jgi:hypothetical protein
MREIPMLFDQSSVQGILAGVKTQTRRVGDITHRVKVGDVIWVRETYKIVDGELFYRASTPAAHPDTNWKPSLFMRKEYSRMRLTVKRVWTEQLQDINEDDAKAEGMFYDKKSEFWIWHSMIYAKLLQIGITPRHAYLLRWDSIAKEGAKCNDNPLVTAIEFEPVIR